MNLPLINEKKTHYTVVNKKRNSNNLIYGEVTFESRFKCLETLVTVSDLFYG